MEINYIILAYNHPHQVKRLVNRLNSNHVNFYIHIDRKSHIQEFKDALLGMSNVAFLSDEQRVDCRWGDLSLVNAVLNCFRRIIEDGKSGFVALLSGQDYPVRSPEYIENFLEQNIGNDFLSIYPIPDPKKKSEKGGMERFLNYTIDCCNEKDARMKAKIRPFSLNLKTIVGFFRLLRYRRNFLGWAIKKWFKPRKYPQCLAKVFNEFWFVFRIDTIRYILSFLKQHPEVLEFYQYTHIPDETMFGSILCADEVHKKALRPMCHLIDWNTNQHGSPKTFTLEDINYITTSCENNPNLLFARKFNEDDKILDLLDKK